MQIYPDILVLRHGQTLWNAAGRHQGQRDSDLTETGRAQARRQGEILVAIAPDPDNFSFHVSPQGRARQTARLALSGLGQEPQVDPRLMEVGFGQWEGLTKAEIDARWPANGDCTDPFAWHFTAPDGERFEALCARAQSFLDDLAGPAVIVTHGITSRVLRGLWLGLDMAGMAAIEGGQGVVYHMSQRRQVRISEPPVNGGIAG
jgi:probable phosphoglycerate mutase